MAGRFDGEPAVAISPSIAEDLPPELREGLARRHLVATGQPCPCGAQPPMLPRRVRRALAARERKGLPTGITQFSIIHEADCPAADPRLNDHGRGVDLIVWRP